MKTKHIFISALAAACMSWLVSAQDQKKGAEDLINPPYQPYSERGASRLSPSERLEHPERANGIVGMRIENDQHEKLGKVDDLAVDLESGRIVEVILSTGGLLGVGEKEFALPPGALRCEFPNKVIRLDADKEKLKAAPRFEMSRWAECCQPTQVQEVYRYYGEAPYFSTNVDAPRTDRGENRIVGGALRVQARESTTHSSAMGYVEKGTKLIGLPAKNLQNENLGKVDNLMVDLPAGRVVAVILSSGGFLGLGDELSAVPPTALRYNQDHDGVILDASKESLTQAPHFKSTDWPDFGEPVYVERVYRVYQIEPYFSTDNADTDNTRRNVRDRNGETLTATDQGRNAADRQTTAHIRQEIVAQKDLSISAKNVKIITANGRVTLRGTVQTVEEKRRVEEIAKRNATADNVDNQLEVKEATGQSSN